MEQYENGGYNPYRPYNTNNANNQLKKDTFEYPMKWFKFVIWFQLFANAFLNFLMGMQVMNGNHYGAFAYRVYSVFPDMESLDRIYGIVLIALAAFAIFVRFCLSAFRENGPKMYFLLLGANVVASAVYMIAAKVIVDSASGLSLDLSSNIGSLAVSVVLLLCNISYFNKRAHLFEN